MNKSTDSADNTDIKKDPLTHQIIGAAMEVHSTLGHGFLEAVYHEALGIEFASKQIPFQGEVELPIYYKNELLTTIYRADFVCYNNIIVELKAINQLSSKEESQIINYLKATGLKTGLLFNFGAKSLEYKRFIFTKGKSVKSAKSV
ncbi:MAG: GxxExxY protein, partial [Nitrospirae bacterium]|nr:GxxExxY protein [Nitrospirota bacterium]